MACDHWSENGTSVRPNAGFYLVRSNHRTLRFMDYWMDAHMRCGDGCEIHTVNGGKGWMCGDWNLVESGGVGVAEEGSLNFNI